MSKKKFFNIVIAILSYLLFLILYNMCDLNQFKNYNFFNYILCFLGIIVYIYIIKLNYFITKKILTPFTIIYSFLFLFNYGQCVLWVFNIHPENSIEKSTIFNAGYATDLDIVKTQLVTITSIFLYGITNIFIKRNNKKCKSICNKEIDKEKISIKAIKTISIIFLIISTLCTYIILFNNIKISVQYGYKALYYGDNIYQGNTIIILLSRFFLPSLFGLYLTSYKNKKTINLIYFLFLIYLLGNLFTGDRGSWIYSFCLFLWLHHVFVKKIDFKTALILILFGFFGISIIYAIVDIRDSGISISKILNTLNFNNNPIIELFSELGSSMKIQLYLLMNGYNIYPYGNSYLLGILGIFSDKIVKIFIPEYVIMDSWFSQTYLQLNYGAGFSIVGEAILNFGPYVAPLIVMFIGYLFNLLINNDKVIYEKNSKSILLCLCVSISLITMFRGILAYSIKMFLYQVIFFFICIKILEIFISNKEKNRR